MVVLSLLSFRGCPVLVVLSLLSCRGFLVVVFFSWLSCPGCLVGVALSWLSLVFNKENRYTGDRRTLLTFPFVGLNCEISIRLMNR